MNRTLIETQARHQITERVARASAPHLPVVRRRHRVADGIRRFADRLDG
jgi:hypothetical protein